MVSCVEVTRRVRRPEVVFTHDCISICSTDPRSSGAAAARLGSLRPEHRAAGTVDSVIGWSFVAVGILAIVGFIWSQVSLWNQYRDTVALADDLRRADDGYQFPTDDGTGGWL